jgi:sterol desaturase/sphingolipid hydroxylase (fatty acid hydroxylase superfamily)
MMSGVLAFEPWIRGALFVATCTVLLGGEAVAPRRPPRATAWPNLALLLTNTILARAVSVASIVGLAVLAEARGWGALHAASLPPALAFIVAVVALDFGMYAQHRLLHRVAWLWRLHRVHHSDTEFDFTTGVRFHPGEILISLGWKTAMVIALGASGWAALAFEASLSTASLFTHANLRLPGAVDAALRRLVVTPEVHRVHHSVDPDEYNRNFGFVFIWWDRWLGTYRAQPRLAAESMPIGLRQFRDSAQQRFTALILQPIAARRGVQ